MEQNEHRTDDSELLHEVKPSTVDAARQDLLLGEQPVAEAHSAHLAEGLRIADIKAELGDKNQTT